MADSFGQLPDHLRGLKPAAKPQASQLAGNRPAVQSDGRTFPSRQSSVPTGPGSTSTASPSVTVTRPPLWVLALAGLLGAAGAALGVAGTSGVAIPLLGWVLSGLAAFGAVAAFMVIDGDRRGQAGYSTTSTDAWIYRVVIVVAFVGLVICAGRLGLYVGRQ
jgi:hypothetical protein